MKNLALALLVGAMTTVASAQQFPAEPYEFLMAKMAAAEGRYDEALSRIDRVIEKNPDNQVLRFERAMMLIDANQGDKAESELRKIVTAQPDSYDAQRVLGRLLLDRSGNDKARVEEALQHLQAAYKLNPDDLATGVAVSQLLSSMGRTAEAERVLALLLERAPDQRALNYNYAQILTKLGRGNESKQYLERAVLLDPTFAPAILQLVDIYQKQNEYEKAADVLQPLVEEDPMNLDLQRQQGFFYLRAGKSEKARNVFKALVASDPKDTRSQFYLAEALSDLEQYADADKIYRSLLEKTPNDPEVLASFGLVQTGQHKFDEAKKTFEALLRLPDLPDNLQVLAKTQLALIASQTGNLDQAVTMAGPILVFRDKPNAQAVNIALDALKKQKKYREAVNLMQPLVNQFGSDPFVNARYVEMLARAGDTAKAKEAAATQEKFGPRNSIAVAEAFVQADQFPVAIDILKRAVAKKPDDMDVLFQLGSVYERSGDKASAEKTFLQLLQDHPDHAATLNYLGYMWAEGGVNLDRAAEMLNRAVNQEPLNGAYVDSLGWVYFRQGKLDLAEKYLTDATHLLPRDATVHEHLADVFAKRGDNTRALSLYRTALTLEPEAKDEASIKNKIAEIEKQTQTTLK